MKVFLLCQYLAKIAGNHDANHLSDSLVSVGIEGSAAFVVLEQNLFAIENKKRGVGRKVFPSQTVGLCAPHLAL